MARTINKPRGGIKEKVKKERKVDLETKLDELPPPTEEDLKLPETTKKGQGRGNMVPIHKLDKRKIVLMAQFGATLQEMGEYFGVHPDTLKSRYGRLIKSAAAEFKFELRREQAKIARSGGKEGAEMLKFLGKYYLNQKDDPSGGVQVVVNTGSASEQQQTIGEVFDAEYTEIDPLLLPDEDK